MKDFEYFEPTTVHEAISLLSKYKEKAKALAGGTDLLVDMKQKKKRPQYMVNIKSVPHLKYIRSSDSDGLRIGALTSIRDIETSSVIKEKFGILTQAAHVIGSVQIRTRATIGGNLCQAAPSADTAPALIGLGARVTIRGSEGERSVSLEEFFEGPGETALRADEILTEIQIPNCAPGTAGVYLKLGRLRSMDLALVGVAVVIVSDPAAGICSDVRIVLGAVAPTPIRAKKAEEIVRGTQINEALIEEAAQIASIESRPISDVRASAEYRREMVKVLCKRAFKEVWDFSK